jgi:hypothetical protein
MRESDCLAEHESFPRMCLLSQPGPRYLVRSRGLLQPRGSGLYVSFRGYRKVRRGKKMHDGAVSLVIAVLVVIILVLLALGFF